MTTQQALHACTLLSNGLACLHSSNVKPAQPEVALTCLRCGLQGGGQGEIAMTSRSIQLGMSCIIPKEDLELGAPLAVGVDYKEHLGTWCGLPVVARQCLDREYGPEWHTTDNGEVWVNNLDLLEEAGWNMLKVSLSKSATIRYKDLMGPQCA